jgi:hypothetical protein
MFFGIRTNVWAAYAAILVGIILIVVQSRRHTGLPVSVYAPGREWKGLDAEVESEEFDSDPADHGDEAVRPADENNVAATSTSNSRL